MQDKEYKYLAAGFLIGAWASSVVWALTIYTSL
jgi:hypothetical protein